MTPRQKIESEIRDWIKDANPDAVPGSEEYKKVYLIHLTGMVKWQAIIMEAETAEEKERLMTELFLMAVGDAIL